MLYGAIIGDIAGSIYEFSNVRHKPDEILDYECFYTDDTVMTIAVAHALISEDKYDFESKMRAWGNRYPNKGYGAMFSKWLLEGGGPYNSFGNGSAMRVSPVAYAFPTLDDVKEAARLTAIPTHDHPEGVKGAEAVAVAIYLANLGYRKSDLLEYIELVYGYRTRPCDEIRPTYQFDETCQGTIPEALSAFKESTDFEDCIKLAISLGGDSDTLAAITGSIAEAYYGIPYRLINRCRAFLPLQMLDIIDDFEEMYMKGAGRRR